MNCFLQEMLDLLLGVFFPPCLLCRSLVEG